MIYVTTSIFIQTVYVWPLKLSPSQLASITTCHAKATVASSPAVSASFITKLYFTL